jgi:hypothetical protein
MHPPAHSDTRRKIHPPLHPPGYKVAHQLIISEQDEKRPQGWEGGLASCILHSGGWRGG